MAQVNCPFSTVILLAITQASKDVPKTLMNADRVWSSLPHTEVRFLCEGHLFSKTENKTKQNKGKENVKIKIRKGEEMEKWKEKKKKQKEKGKKSDFFITLRIKRLNLEKDLWHIRTINNYNIYKKLNILKTSVTHFLALSKINIHWFLCSCLYHRAFWSSWQSEVFHLLKLFGNGLRLLYSNTGKKNTSRNKV